MFKLFAILCSITFIPISAFESVNNFAASLNQDPNAVEENIAEFLENHRTLIPDPLVIPEIEVIKTYLFLEGHAEITNINITGLSGYEIEELEVTGMFTYKFKLLLNYPSINISYRLTSNLNFGPYDLGANNSVDIKITNFKVNITTTINSFKGPSFTLNLNDYKLYLTVEGITVEYRSAYLSDQLNQEISDYLTDNSANWVNNKKEDISGSVSPVVQFLANVMLGRL